MPLRYDTVSFLSDYGRTDEFVGVVHSVIRSLAPEVAIVDLTHDVAPYDVRAGGLTLARSSQYLCPGVVLAVVDPGVGGDRRGVAIEVGDGASVLVGPDNGLLAPAVAMCGGATRAVELANPDYRLPSPGPTFAGRDVFAPAVAHLCLGVDLSELGPAVAPTSLLPGMLPVSYHDGEAVVGEVLWIDRYGNAQLNVDPDEIDDLGPRVRLRFGDEVRGARRAEAFEQIAAGQVGLVIDSYGLVAIAVDRRSAAQDLGLAPGSEVRLEPYPDDAPDDDPSVAGGAVTEVALTRRERRP
jgi:S-adenosyl-L-methionine hydrolase (adenosine-forming)